VTPLSDRYHAGLVGGGLRLKHRAEIQTGIALSGDGDPADASWPYLRVANVQTGFIDLSEVKYIRVPAAVASTATLRQGDVLMTEGGDIDKLGRGALWDASLAPMLHQNHIFAVRANGDLAAGFLVYWLEAQVARDYFLTTAKRSTNLASTNKWTVSNLPIPGLTLDEQLAIADYLNRETARIDTLIAEQQRLVSLLLERRVSVIAEPFERDLPIQPLSSLLDVLIDHRGKTPTKVGGTDFTEEGVPVVSAVHIKNGRISWLERERFVPLWMFEKWMPVRLRRGDVLLTSEAPLGNIAQVPDDEPLVLSQRLFALRGKAGLLDSTYLRYYLESGRGQSLLRDRASGTTVSGIRQSKLVQIPVLVPSLAEQREVVGHLKEQTAKIDDLIAETKRFIELSRERRNALITAAVTGQIDVRGEVA
jgi:restriction endonuclease S subunit